MDSIILLYFFACAFIVLAFAVNYFNQPSYKFADEDKDTIGDQEDLMLEPALPKYLTDRFEYNLYLFAYVLVTEFIYVLLVLFLPDLMQNDTAGDANPLQPTSQNIVLATLIITGIAPNLPYIRKLLERSKLYLHEKAQIPRKGRDVYRQIKRYQPHYTQAEITRILNDKRYLRNRENGQKLRMDLLGSDFKNDGWSMEGRWAKLSYLLHYINRWSKSAPFRSYIGNRELQRSSIERAYDGLQTKMAQYKNGKLSESETVRLNSRVDATLHRTYRLISCLLYLAGKTDSAVDRYLDQLGYAASERNDFPIPWKRLVFVLIAITGSIAVGGILALIVTQLGIVNLPVKIRTENIFRWIGFAVPFLSIPVLAVLLIKRYLSLHSEAWPVMTENTRYNDLGDRPWHLYAIVAFVAYLVGVVILYGTSISVRLAHGHYNIDYSAMLRQVLVWSGVVFVTASFTAFRLDSAPDFNLSKQARFARRILGALLQGVTTTLAVYVAFVHTFAQGELNPLVLPPVDQGKLSVYCIIAFFLGASLYVASGFGRLRQRRHTGRRKVKRSVVINSAHKASVGNTVNVSREGALIESLDSFPSGYDPITISDKDGTSAEGRVVKVRNNNIHVHFTDQSRWGLVQKGLEIPAPP